MKKFLSVLAIAAGLQFGLVQAAQAVDSANLPAFQQKLYANGEPIKAKPLVLRDFIELRSARGFSKAVLEDPGDDRYLGDVVRALHPFASCDQKASGALQQRQEQRAGCFHFNRQEKKRRGRLH